MIEITAAVIPLHFLNGGDLAAAAFLTIGRSERPPARPGLDNLHGFANRRTGGDHVIHQHYPALQRATDQIAAFAMGFCLFAVKAVRQIAVMMLG